MTLLAQAALGVAIDEAHWGVREEGGNNRGPRIDQYLRNTDPPISIAAPWCAAFTQMCSDVAARALRVPNPLDEVRLEAFVQSYVNWADTHGLFVEHGAALPGDLVCFLFRNARRFNHIGFLLTQVEDDGTFQTVEGNTNELGSREGDGVLQVPPDELHGVVAFDGALLLYHALNNPKRPRKERGTTWAISRIMPSPRSCRSSSTPPKRGSRRSPRRR